jgi:hypothetical protein
MIRVIRLSSLASFAWVIAPAALSPQTPSASRARSSARAMLG